MSSYDFSDINKFLVTNSIRIKNNPAISPDMVLDIPAFYNEIKQVGNELSSIITNITTNELSKKVGNIIIWSKSAVTIQNATLYLVENDETGDMAWVSIGSISSKFEKTENTGNLQFIPCTWQNLIILKNQVFKSDPATTIFPRATGTLEYRSLGIGARFTTLHWPAVAWAMKALDLPLTANQNSIPRELVYDVNAMLENRLSSVPFPFIGRSVPEGHQGQSVQGMSHASILTFVKYGFHINKIPYGFNADHQPIGGRFDLIENELVTGSVFASYITYDLSPELSQCKLLENSVDIENQCNSLVGNDLLEKIQSSLVSHGIEISKLEVMKIAGFIAPAMNKMLRRDELYTKVRKDHFTNPEAQKFFKELSIDELPGETTADTIAICLAMSEAMGVKFNFIAPNIGFQKNCPYDDNAALQKKVSKLYDIAKRFGVSIGFHSGSGKSAENYKIAGTTTDGHFEIKTSGRYTYEMGVALAQSKDTRDTQLWNEWFEFTKKIALDGAFSENELQQKFARDFIKHSLNYAKRNSENVFLSKDKLEGAINSLPSSPEYMFWFEYNFLFVLAANGEIQRLGDHSPEGYLQRKRFYMISEKGKLLYAKQVAKYIIFLAQTTGIINSNKAQEKLEKINNYNDYSAFLEDIN